MAKLNPYAQAAGHYADIDQNGMCRVCGWMECHHLDKAPENHPQATILSSNIDRWDVFSYAMVGLLVITLTLMFILTK